MKNELENEEGEGEGKVEEMGEKVVEGVGNWEAECLSRISLESREVSEEEEVNGIDKESERKKRRKGEGEENVDAGEEGEEKKELLGEAMTCNDIALQVIFAWKDWWVCFG